MRQSISRRLTPSAALARARLAAFLSTDGGRDGTAENPGPASPGDARQRSGASASSPPSVHPSADPPANPRVYVRSHPCPLQTFLPRPRSRPGINLSPNPPLCRVRRTSPCGPSPRPARSSASSASDPRHVLSTHAHSSAAATFHAAQLHPTPAPNNPRSTSSPSGPSAPRARGTSPGTPW